MGLSEIRKLKFEAGLPKTKKTYSIPKVSKKRAAQIEADKKAATKPAGKFELDKWFHDIHTKHFNDKGYFPCMECGASIPFKFSRHATAHLLPKKLFKSVATHPLNYLILGAGCGDHEKTHRIDKFITMKIWPEAARRIKILIPLLPVEELGHISNQLLIALDNI